jgi:hypothetical protein
MKSMKITESDRLYVVELSSGARASGASLESALSKLVPTNQERLITESDYLGVRVIFDAIPNAMGGQIRRGVASA